MPKGLKRYYGAGDVHFITCSCYQRKPWLDTGERRDLFLEVLEEVRKEHRFVVLGYVVMPEHFHLLMSEPQVGTPSTAMQSAKQRFAQRVVPRRRHTPAPCKNGKERGTPKVRVRAPPLIVYTWTATSGLPLDMNDLLSLIARHGYLLIFVIALAESIGLPMPAALALIAGGAAVAAHTLEAPQVIILPMIAMLMGDTLLFILGRYAGWGLLGLLCRISVNPESCILRSAESFYKRGKVTLLFAKFLPGINTMAAPLAGSMKMRPQQFLRLDLAGACLYTLTYCSLGYIFHDFLAVMTHGIYTASHAMGIILCIALVVYAGYRVWLYRKNAPYRVVPRVQVTELMRKLESEEKHTLVIADVRSHGYYDSHAERIRGSIRLEPNNLSGELEHFPRDKDIYLYCT